MSLPRPKPENVEKLQMLVKDPAAARCGGAANF